MRRHIITLEESVRSDLGLSPEVERLARLELIPESPISEVPNFKKLSVKFSIFCCSSLPSPDPTPRLFIEVNNLRIIRLILLNLSSLSKLVLGSV